jgi:hypothetical protein
MHIALRGAFIALALTGATLTSVGAARAADVGVSVRAPGVSFSLGEVAIGYNDGYWDKSHQWHEWQNTDHRDAYKSAKGSEYHEWKHDRDPDQGWHEGDKRK